MSDRVSFEAVAMSTPKIIISGSLVLINSSRALGSITRLTSSPPSCGDVKTVMT